MESKVGGAFIMRGIIYANFFRKSTKCGNRKKKRKKSKVASLLNFTHGAIFSKLSLCCPHTLSKHFVAFFSRNCLTATVVFALTSRGSEKHALCQTLLTSGNLAR